MADQLKDRSDLFTPNRAPEVFLILDSLMRPQPAPEQPQLTLKTPLRPYMPAIELQPVELPAEL